MIESITSYKKTVECPYCGKEYQPCEIYLPNHLLGKSYIERDVYGKPTFIDEKVPQDLTETYTCDDCGKTFKVTARLEFATSCKSTDSNEFRVSLDGGIK